MYSQPSINVSCHRQFKLVHIKFFSNKASTCAYKILEDRKGRELEIVRERESGDIADLTGDPPERL